MYVTDLLDAVEADPYWPYPVKVLHHYGMLGRFYYLNYLANGSAGRWGSPLAHWDELEQKVPKDRPELFSALTSCDQATVDQVRPDLSRVIAQSLLDWWEMVYCFWIQAALSDRVRQISSEIKLDVRRE